MSTDKVSLKAVMVETYPPTLTITENEMEEIQIGTSTFNKTDFFEAVQDSQSCGECKYCQQNKRVPNRIMDWSCYHPDNMQQHEHCKQSMRVSDDFLCNKFEY